MNFYATKRDEKFYHFYTNLMAYSLVASKNEPIYEVSVEEVEESDGCYYGWKDKQGNVSMIWPAMFLFEMCFPYGSTVEVERGAGTVVFLSVTENGIANNLNA